MSNRAVKLLGAALTATVAAASGCAGDAVYTPQGQLAQAGGVMSAQYDIPPSGGSMGHLYVTSFGAKTLPASQNNPGGPYLQVRLALANDTDAQAWTLDARDQVADFDGQVQVPSSYAEGSAGAGVPVAVARGQHGFLDLYYRLPPQVDPRTVQVAWKIRRGEGEIADRTTFQRSGGRDQTAYLYEPYGQHVYLGLGVGAGWWWGPRPWWAWGWDWPYDTFWLGWGWRPHPYWYGYGYGYGGYYGRGWGRGYGGGVARPYYRPGPVGGGWHGGGGRPSVIGRPGHR